MIATLQLVTLLIIGYLGTHFVAQRLRRRFHVVTGVEFLVLGVLVGPDVAGIMRAEVLLQLQPVVSVALGAIGLVLGLRFRFERLIVHHGESLLLAFFAVTAVFLLVGGAAVGLVLISFPRSAWAGGLPGAVALGAVAAVSGSGAIESIRQELRGGGRLGSVLEIAARLCQVLATILFGLVFCAFHLGVAGAFRPLTAVEWMVANVGFGIALGVLFFLFLGRERDPQRLLLALIGIVLFASGTAYYLDLSPLFTNLALGAMLSNTSRHADELRSVLEELEQPIIVVVLVVAGASWNLNALGYPLVWAFIGVCLIGRPVAQAMGGWLAHRYGERTQALTPWMGGGLLAHGALAIAMAVDFRQVYSGLTADAMVSAVIASVLLWEVLAPPRIRVALIDAEPNLASPVPTPTASAAPR